jgi:hypothetical protein
MVVEVLSKKEMTNQPDWMYELYRESFSRIKDVNPEWEKKRPEEKSICPQGFKFRDDPYSHWLESKGLI